MKNCIVFLFLFLVYQTTAQDFQAKYIVQKDMFGQMPNGTQEKITTLEYEGFFFKKKNKFLYYKKPLYLSKYPEGQISISNQANVYQNFEIYMDTIQSISYKDMDSLLWKYRFDLTGTGNVTENYVQAFEPGFQEWQFHSETKTINGLKCQKATRDVAGKISWEVWFCPDIPMATNISNIFDLPGLVVEAENFSLNERYALDSYSLNAEVSDSVFSLKEFEQPFISRKTIKKGITTQNKTQKLLEISDQ